MIKKSSQDLLKWSPKLQTLLSRCSEKKPKRKYSQLKRKKRKERKIGKITSTIVSNPSKTGEREIFRGSDGMFVKKPRLKETSLKGSIKTYFIIGQTTRLIKIGRTKNVGNRLRDLQTGSPDILEILRTVPGNYEECFHKIFKKHRKHGEWFAIPNIDLENALLNYRDIYLEEVKFLGTTERTG